MAAVVVALAVGRCSLPPETITGPVITHVDTVAPAEMMALLESGALENSRLNRIVRGYEARRPSEIIRTDTLRTPPDTVLQLVRVDGESLIVAPLIKDSIADTQSRLMDTLLYRPELHTFNVSGCDDGWSWAAGELVCDRARFGHLSPFVLVGLYAEGVARPTPTVRPLAALGLEWTPSFRSGWRASAGAGADGRFSASVTRQWALF